MKKLLILLVLTTALMSCEVYTGTYKIGLQQVESPKNSKDQFGETKVVNVQSSAGPNNNFEDSLIKITWMPLPNEFGFSLTNKTEYSIKVLWDNAAYVDENGSSQKVFHSNVKYINKSNPQPPTTIVKKTKIDDLIVPINMSTYIIGQSGDGWKDFPLFQNKISTPEDLVALKERYIGKIVKVLLPLEIEKTINEYLFTFKIEDFIRNANTEYLIGK